MKEDKFLCQAIKARGTCKISGEVSPLNNGQIDYRAELALNKLIILRFPSLHLEQKVSVSQKKKLGMRHAFNVGYADTLVSKSSMKKDASVTKDYE